jgi:hypothetical protein
MGLRGTQLSCSIIYSLVNYSHIFGRRNEKGVVIELPDGIEDSMCTHITELEDLVRDVEIERYNEIFNNDELRAQLAEKDKQHLEQEKRIKEMEEKFETHEKQRKSQGSKLGTMKLES